MIEEVLCECIEFLPSKLSRNFRLASSSVSKQSERSLSSHFINILQLSSTVMQ